MVGHYTESSNSPLKNSLASRLKALPLHTDLPGALPRLGHLLCGEVLGLTKCPGIQIKHQDNRDESRNPISVF